MKMTLEEKDSLFARIISEHLATQKTSPVYVPTSHVEAKGFDTSDTNNALWRLKDNGAIKKYRRCWGFFEVQNGKKKFVITSANEQQTDEDAEVFEVEVVLGRLAQMTKNRGGVSKTNDAVVLHLNKNGDLFKEPREKFCYEMMGAKVPLKILRYFIDNPNTEYEQSTEDIASSIGMKAEQLRKDIGEMRRTIKNRLKLPLELFEGRQGSGYRLNPKVEIIQEN